MAIRYRGPVAECDVCHKEFPAEEKDVAGRVVGEHPAWFFRIYYRTNEAACCSKECAVRHIGES